MLKSETVDFVLAPPVGESSAKPLAVLLLDVSCAPATLEAMKAAVLQVAFSYPLRLYMVDFEVMFLSGGI